MSYSVNLYKNVAPSLTSSHVQAFTYVINTLFTTGGGDCSDTVCSLFFAGTLFLLMFLNFHSHKRFAQIEFL